MTRSPWKRYVTTCAIAIMCIVSLFGSIVVSQTTSASAAALLSGCSYAEKPYGDKTGIAADGNNYTEQGAYAQSLCWIDMSSVDFTKAAQPNGTQLSISLGSGYTFRATITLTGNTGVTATSLPTWAKAYLGNANPKDVNLDLTGKGFYYGVQGQPAIYQNINAETTTVTLSNIAMYKDSSPTQAVSGYSLVVADAESTDWDEHITWSTSGGGAFTVLPNDPSNPTKPFGNACNQDNSGFSKSADMRQVTCATTQGSSSAQSYVKTGTVMLSSNAPSDSSNWTISQLMKGHGKEAVAFGIMVAKTGVTKNIGANANGPRADAGDSFTVKVNQGTSTNLGEEFASASTGTTANTATASTEVPVSTTAATPFVLSEQADNGTLLSSYNATWSCKNNTPGGTAVLTSPASGPVNIALKVGDDVECTVTNTVKTDGALAWQKVDATNQQRLSGSEWTLSGPSESADTSSAPTRTITDCISASQCTAQGDVDPITGQFSLTGLQYGHYTLTEIKAPEGYTIDDSAKNIAITINGANPAVTLTPIRNNREPGTVTWRKSDASEQQALLSGSEWRILKTQPTADNPNPSVVKDTNGVELSGITECGPQQAATPCVNYQNGVFSVTNLPWGTYYLQETQAPAGFTKNDTTYPFTIDATHLAVSVGTQGSVATSNQADPIANHQAEVPELPLTGGQGSDLFIWSGVAVMALTAALSLGVSIRRRVRWH